MDTPSQSKKPTDSGQTHGNAQIVLASGTSSHPTPGIIYT